MIKIGSHPCLAATASKVQLSGCMKWLQGLFVVALLMAPCSHAAVEDPEAQYIKILAVIDSADTLKTSGNNVSARSKYHEAHLALQNLKKYYPTWNTKIVGYRLKYVGDKIDALSQPAPGAPRADAAGAEPTAAPSGIQVKLLDAGAEPRRVLRVQAKVGDKQTLGMTVKMDTNMEMSGMPAQAMKIPAIKMDMEVTVKEVSPNGDVTYETLIGEASIVEEAGVMPQVAEAMKTSLGGLEGLSGTGTISSRGLSKSTDMKLPPGADPQLRQTMEQMHESFSKLGTAFPEEAVGPGARWEVRLPIKSQGMTITQTTTYQLASIEGENLNLKNAIVQHAANQTIQNPAMPGLKVKVTKLTGSGSGNAAANLTQVLPSRATMDSKSEMNMEMNVSGQTQTMTMKVDIHLLLESK